MKTKRYWYGRHRTFKLFSAFFMLIAMFVSGIAEQAAIAATATLGRVQVTDNTEALYVEDSGWINCAAAPTELFVKSGSASKTVYIQKVEVECQADTYSFYYKMSLIKRSTAGSGGTSTSASAIPLDSGFASATSTAMKCYTANPTVGTSVGVISTFIIQNNYQLNTGIGAFTGFQFPDTPWDSSKDGGPIVLRGTAETIGVNIGGITIGGSPQFRCRITYKEK